MATPPASPPLPPSERPERYGSGMLRRFGWLYRVLGFGRFFSQVEFEDHSAERVRAAARSGPVVYILLQRSTLDHLVLNTVLNRRRLPLTVWSQGAVRFFWQPVGEAWAQVFSRLRDRFRRGPLPHPVRSGWLSSIIAGGQTVALFLEDDPEGGPDPGDDPLAAAISAQAHSDRPVQLVPVILVWNRAPDTHESAALTFLRGSRERPTLLTRLGRIFAPGTSPPLVQVGEPLDLRAFLDRVPEERARVALRTLLRRFLKRESRTVRGPTMVGRRALETQVLDAPPMRRWAAQHAAETGRSVEEVRADMRKEFHTVAADFRFGLIRFLSWAMRPLWRRVYSGYEIPEEDLDRIRSAMRDGTAVIVSCHKSHFDYLLLSWVLYHANMVTPHIVAGINLAIWPVSILLRSAGAFFIERSFSGRPIHAVVFKRYLLELLLHGYTVEFFIEGGRTRTGRLLPARLGVLEMVIDATRHTPRGHEITLLPVAISYEQVAEERSYQSELGGADKRKEDMKELIKARSVLRNRYGRVFVRVGEPMRASEVLEGLPEDADEDAVRARVQTAGDELVHRIGQVITVLPTSVVAVGLLADARAGTPDDELGERVDRIVAWLGRRNAIMTSLVGQHPEAARARALGRFAQAGHVRAHDAADGRIWEAVTDRRIVLDFHKNQVMHHFVAAGLVAAALRACDGGCSRADLVDPVDRLRTLWRRELALPPATSGAGLVDEGLRDLNAHGALRLEPDGTIRIADLDRIGEIHGLVRALLESYLIAATAPTRPGLSAADPKGWGKVLTGEREALLASGEATRPEAFAAVTLVHAIKEITAAGGFEATDGRLVPVPDVLDDIVGWLRPMVHGPHHPARPEGLPS